ncbi:anthranilate synthase component I family protein [Larkinella terrae]|uniref:Anthranilate synthase component 1 n=1 Tax=Larkinella terrae TaxID=2025311 RepID=A0A7K0EVE7_9BACT|nr:anthranilate synthase component I family protein [Larkinella terrae]MRS65790.1 anthranilate synthase component I family protein [Larkinella terrae]
MITSVQEQKNRYNVTSSYRKMLADTLTPVSIYLRLRDKFVNSILLESSDYHGHDNSYSYICFDPVSKFEFDGKTIAINYPDGQAHSVEISANDDLLTHIEEYRAGFNYQKLPFSFITNGLFGHIGYNAVQFFEDITLQAKTAENDVPLVVYQAFRYVIAINHFKDELYLFEHSYSQDGDETTPDNLDYIETLIKSRNFPAYTFQTTQTEQSNFTDSEFLEIIQKGIDHCHRGDVFQIVLSRKFSTAFRGDEFNVYRTLRSLNPSPYLFYFDYGNYKLFGSSPEAQIVIKGQNAIIYPIAGTFRRTGDDAADAELAKKLHNDPKETSEHVMLVDLARNDLSRNCKTVKVETFKEVQFYSHVIHLVSKVVGELAKNVQPLRIVGETFPAGTLSGAPKHRAMQLIDQYEKTSRGFYAGCIGFMDFSGDFNQAIMIRTFLSKNNTLHYQAGAGIVAKSDPESELQEVHNKLMALRTAMKQAETI